jgi:hypothetical protein
MQTTRFDAAKPLEQNLSKLGEVPRYPDSMYNRFSNVLSLYALLIRPEADVEVGQAYKDAEVKFYSKFLDARGPAPQKMLEDLQQWAQDLAQLIQDSWDYYQQHKEEDPDLWHLGPSMTSKAVEAMLRQVCAFAVMTVMARVGGQNG